MQPDNYIDSHLKQLEAQQLPDLSQMDNHWQQMQTLLTPGTPVPPKRRSWRKITRKKITYMGVVAVIITTTYYTMQNTGKRMLAKKPLPVQVNTKTVVPKSGPVAKSVLAGTANASVHARKNHVTVSIVRQETDTVFLQIPEQSRKKETPGLTVQSFYERLKRPEQQFIINPSKDTSITGKDGTILRIRANSFIYPDNSFVKTPVNLSLTECYQYADMLAHCLDTRSGDKQLVTGGMIRLQAHDGDNKELALLKYKPIRVSMPAEQFDPQMQLFVPVIPPANPIVEGGSGGDTIALQPGSPIIDWQPVGQSQGYTRTVSSLRIRSKIKLMDIRQEVSKGTGSEEKIYQVIPLISIPEQSIKEQLALRYNLSDKTIKLQTVDSFVRESKAKNTNVAFTSLGMVARDSVMVYYDVAVKNGWVSRKDSLAYVEQLRIDSIAYVENRRADSITWIRQREFDRNYHFDITGLGWINCDKFLRSSGAEVDFTIRIDTELERAPHRYNLIFTNMRSIMTGKYQNGEIQFGVLPKDEPVKLICVAGKNGKTFACIRSFNISAGIMASLKFEEVDPQKFREMVERL